MMAPGEGRDQGSQSEEVGFDGVESLDDDFVESPFVVFEAESLVDESLFEGSLDALDSEVDVFDEPVVDFDRLSFL